MTAPTADRIQLRMAIEIRDERPQDVDAIRQVNLHAFGQDLEGRLVDALRANGAVLVSLVATMNDRVVGHILYSPISVGAAEGAALGPMSVLPEFQGRGIGSLLVESGNQRINSLGCPFIIVLGHAEFYPRFGFVPASTYGITCEWEVPDNVFMTLILDPDHTRHVSGQAKYRPEFSLVM